MHNAPRLGVASGVGDLPTAYRDLKVAFWLAVAFVLVMPFARAFQWHPGVYFDVSDVLFLPLLALFAPLAVKKRDETPTVWQELPGRRLWCAYGLFIAIAYARWSYEAGFLGAGALYQFYRYCWKPMLLYPITFYMVARPGGIQWLIAAAIVTADVNAVAAIQQGRAGVDVRGMLSLFDKNMLASSFLVPLFLSLGEGLHASPWLWRQLARVSVLLLGAALWYAVSRGAMVAAAAGAVVYVLVSPRGWRFAVGALALVALVLVVRPDFGSSSGILDRFIDIGNGADSGNLAWRMKERWPHFVEIVTAHPMFGVGQAMDWTLGADTNTPHNGYLALMVQSGIPATLTFVFLLIMILVRALKLAIGHFSRRVRGWGAATLAGGLAFGVHNFVDTTFESGAAGYYYWLACGIAMGLYVRHRQSVPAKPTESLKRGRSKTRRIVAA
jgi:O-antigen ligase